MIMKPFISRIDAKDAVGIIGYKEPDKSSTAIGLLNNGLTVEVLDAIFDEKGNPMWAQVRASYHTPIAWVDAKSVGVAKRKRKK